MTLKVNEGRRRIGHSIDVLIRNEQIVNGLSLFVIVNQGKEDAIELETENSAIIIIFSD